MVKGQGSCPCAFHDGLLSYLIELRIESVEIEKQVDSHIRKGSHASIMVSRRIDVVDSYSVCS